MANCDTYICVRTPQLEVKRVTTEIVVESLSLTTNERITMEK